LLDDNYAVGQVIGSGGFGVVYKAWDRRNHSVVAIKEFFQSGLVTRAPGSLDLILLSDDVEQEFVDGKERFLTEASRTKAFANHENIITVLDYFEQHNTAYYVMEYVDGDTLDDYLAKTPELGVEGGVSIALQIGQALKALHKEGILHRDVSPDNILIPKTYPERGAVLYDFGAARFSRDEKDTPQSRIMKPGYSPPEQYAESRKQNEQVDVYALGATLYYVLTRMKPEEATNRKLADELPTPRSLNAEIPEPLSNTIQKAMAVERHLRFKTIGEFEDALNQKTVSLPPKAEYRRRWRRRRTQILTVSALLIAGWIAAGVLYVSQYWAQWLEADIALWYQETGDEGVDAAKETALAAVVEAFNAEFPRVTVEIEGVAAEDYAAEAGRVARRRNRAVVLESDSLDSELLAQALDISQVVDAAERRDCYFLERYDRHFPDGKQIPVGFNVPAVFINPNLCQFSGSGVSNLSDLLANMPLEVSERGLSLDEAYGEEYEEAFGDADSLSGADAFFGDETGACFSSTARYYAFLEQMPGRMRMLYVDREEVPAEFSGLWSLLPCSGSERQSAEALLRFLLSAGAQDILHLQNQSGALPLHRESLAQYRELYSDYAEFEISAEAYTFN
jgi:hypothetical protein